MAFLDEINVKVAALQTAVDQILAALQASAGDPAAQQAALAAMQAQIDRLTAATATPPTP